MKEKVKEKQFNFIELWKSFLSPDTEEVSEEEAILKDENLTELEKKELLKALKNGEKLANKLFKNSYKTTKLEVSKKDQVNYLKTHPVKLKEDNTQNSSKNKEDKIQEI